MQRRGEGGVGAGDSGVDDGTTAVVVAQAVGTGWLSGFVVGGGRRVVASGLLGREGEGWLETSLIWLLARGSNRRILGWWC